MKNVCESKYTEYMQTTVAVNGAIMFPRRPVNDAIPIAWLLYKANVHVYIYNSYIAHDPFNIRQSVQYRRCCKVIEILVIELSIRNNFMYFVYCYILKSNL